MPMYPPEKPKLDPKSYERVKTNELLNTVIEEVQIKADHIFKGFQGKPDTTQTGIRLKFKVEGMEFAKYSRWMKFSYGEKSSLYKTVLSLVAGMKPDAKFDLERLKGMKVKTLWRDNGDYQNLEIIIPDGQMMPFEETMPSLSVGGPVINKEDEEMVPF